MSRCIRIGHIRVGGTAVSRTGGSQARVGCAEHSVRSNRYATNKIELIKIHNSEEQKNVKMQGDATPGTP